MPTVYVDAPFRTVIRERKDALERQLRDHPNDEVYVSEAEALETLLPEDVQNKIERKREKRDK